MIAPYLASTVMHEIQYLAAVLMWTAEQIPRDQQYVPEAERKA